MEKGDAKRVDELEYGRIDYLVVDRGLADLQKV